MSSFSSNQPLFPAGIAPVSSSSPQKQPVPFSTTDSTSYILNRSRPSSAGTDSGIPTKDHSLTAQEVSPALFSPLAAQVTPPLIMTSPGSGSDDISPIYHSTSSSSFFPSTVPGPIPATLFPSRSSSSPLNPASPNSRNALKPQIAYPLQQQPSQPSGGDPLLASLVDAPRYQPIRPAQLPSQPLAIPGTAQHFRQQQPQQKQQQPYFDDEYADVLNRCLTSDDTLEEDSISPFQLGLSSSRQQYASVSEGYDAVDAGQADEFGGEESPYSEGSPSYMEHSPFFSAAAASAPSPYYMGPAAVPQRGKRRGVRQPRRHSKGGSPGVHGQISSSSPATAPIKHSLSEGVEQNVPYCKFFQEGCCNRGDQCKFLHKYMPGMPLPPLMAPQSLMAQQEQQQLPGDVAATGGMGVSPPLPISRRANQHSLSFRHDFVSSGGSLLYSPVGTVPAKSSSVPPGMISPSASPTTLSPSSVGFGKSPISPYGSVSLFSSPGNSVGTSPTVTFTSGDNPTISGSSTSTTPAGEGFGHVPLPPPPLSSFVGHFVEMSLDQNGSRHLQHQFDIATDDRVVGVVLNETLPSLCMLSCDPIAGYMCQKMMEKANHKQRLAIIASLNTNACDVCCNVHGTRTVQKLAEHLESDDEVEALRKMLAPWVLDLAQNANGNHVLQKCLHKFKPETNQYIYDAITNPNTFLTVATHRHGCCVVQRALDYGNQAQCDDIVAKVVANLLPLVQDAFGNYVTQYVLQREQSHMPLRFAIALKGHVTELSMQKFSSNVIEKIMRSGDPSAAEAIIDELIHVKDMKTLVVHQYANYVIQTALTVSSDAQHRELAAVIIPHQAAIRNTLYGKRIMNKLRRDTKSSTKHSSPSEF